MLVTPALLLRLKGEGIAEKELSALLVRDLLVPIMHGTTYEALREVSPLLGKHPPKAADPRCLIANGALGRGAGATICGRRVFRD